MRIYLLSLLSFLFILTACEDDGVAGIATAEVTGGWKLEKATRNNMTTELLDGLYFNFREDGTLKTNLMGNTTDGTYERSGEEITTTGVSIPLTYTIKEISDTTMVLQSKYQGHQFNFELVRSETE